MVKEFGSVKATVVSLSSTSSNPHPLFKDQVCAVCRCEEFDLPIVHVFWPNKHAISVGMELFLDDIFWYGTYLYATCAVKWDEENPKHRSAVRIYMPVIDKVMDITHGNLYVLTEASLNDQLHQLRSYGYEFQNDEETYHPGVVSWYGLLTKERRCGCNHAWEPRAQFRNLELCGQCKKPITNELFIRQAWQWAPLHPAPDLGKRIYGECRQIADIAYYSDSDYGPGAEALYRMYLFVSRLTTLDSAGFYSRIKEAQNNARAMIRTVATFCYPDAPDILCLPNIGNTIEALVARWEGRELSEEQARLSEAGAETDPNFAKELFEKYGTN